MALTALEPRVTRSKRLSNGLDGNGNGVVGTTSATGTTTRTTKTKVSMKSKATIKNTTTDISHTTKITRASRTTLTVDTSLQTQNDITENNTNAANDEKENIDPLTGLDPLETLALKSGKKKGLGVNGRGGNIVAAEASDVKVANLKAAAAKTQSRAKKPRASLPTQEGNGMETIAGRLVAMRRREAPEDRIARELTVRPLVDLSEAYGIVEKPVVPSKEPVAEAQEQDTQEHPDQDANAYDDDEEPSAHAFIAADLHAALRLLAQATDEHRRLPTVLQRPARGVKRQAINSPATSCSSRASTSREMPATRELHRLSQPTFASSSFSRPTKRMRKSFPGTVTPKITMTPEIEAASVPRVPPNSPVRAPRALPSVTDELPAATTAPIDIPSVSQLDQRREAQGDDYEEETQEQSSFDSTQGSSHFSSVLGSSSFRLGTSFGCRSSLNKPSFSEASIFNTSSSFEAEDERKEQEMASGSWSRWL